MTAGPRSSQIIVPLMLTVFFAKLVGDALSYSIYDTHIKIRGAPVLVRHCMISPMSVRILAHHKQLPGAVSKSRAESSAIVSNRS